MSGGAHRNQTTALDPLERESRMVVQGSTLVLETELQSLDEQEVLLTSPFPDELLLVRLFYYNIGNETWTILLQLFKYCFP